MEQNLKQFSISYIRLISLIFIISCHFMQYYNFVLAWWFNVGVQIFFVISGYLHGRKDIDDFLLFLKNKFLKILIPYWIALFLMSTVYFLYARNSISLTIFLRAFFCESTIEGLGNLWFVGYILFCYLITPYLFLIKKKIKNCSIIKYIFIVIVFIVFLFILSELFNIYFKPYFVCCYIIGYFLSTLFDKFSHNGVLQRNGLGEKLILCVSIILCLLMNIFRIYIKYIKKPELSEKMNQLFTYYEFCSHLVLGVTIFVFFYISFKNSKNSWIVQKSDKYSYCVYLVHQFFILSPFSLMETTPIRFLNWLIYTKTRFWTVS